MKKIAIVIGTYECGCKFGPVSELKKRRFCRRHGSPIKTEFVINYYIQKEDNSKG